MKTIVLLPIKWLLQGHVERYERELKVINDNMVNTQVKARQSGFTTHNSNMLIKNFLLTMKYGQFIKRWKL